MTNREKVITELKAYINYPEPLCSIVKDAIELLKEQEPIQMKVLEDYGSIKFGYCPKCKSLINNRSYPKSCGCGQAVKWDEQQRLDRPR